MGNIDFRGAKEDASRNAILDAAEACARKRAPLQMAAVAEEAGIAVGTVYRYFTDKQHLQDSLMGRVVRILAHDLEERLSGVRPKKERLRTMLQTLCDVALSHAGALYLFLSSSTWEELTSKEKVAAEFREPHEQLEKIELDVIQGLKLKRVTTDAGLAFVKASILAGLARVIDAAPERQAEGIEEIIRLTEGGLVGCT